MIRNTGYLPAVHPALQFLIFLLILPVVFSLALFVGQRDELMGTDTRVYMAMYELVGQCPWCLLGVIESGFNRLMIFSATLELKTSEFLTFVSLLQFALTVYVAKRASKLLAYDQYQRAKWILLFLMLMLASPFFMGAQINVLRQSISVLFVLLLAISFIERRYYQGVLWGVLAISFHSSGLMYIAFLAGLFLSFNLIMSVSLLLFVLYTAGLTQFLVENVSALSGLPVFQMIANYRIDADYQSGVRIDFALFSVFPLLLFFLAQQLPVTNKTIWLNRLKPFLKVYLILLMPFWLFGWANYSDRFAWAAWFAMPLFLTAFIYPVVRQLSLPIFAFMALLFSAYFLRSFI